MQKFHRDVNGLPENLENFPRSICRLTSLAPHAIEQAESDKRGVIQLPDEIIFSGDDILEAELTDTSVKLLIRLPCDDTVCDVCYVILFTGEQRILKTVWLNNKEDSHETLDKSKYL